VRASWAGGLEFKYQADQIFVANGSLQRCKRFAAALTSTQVSKLPWRYDMESGTANSLHTSA